MKVDSLFRKVDEVVCQGRFTGLWQRFGGIVSSLVIALICLVASINAWQYWNPQEAEKAGGAFFNATELAETGKSDKALRSFSAIPAGPFTPFSRMQQAALLTTQSKAPEAVVLYDALAGDTRLAARVFPCCGKIGFRPRQLDQDFCPARSCSRISLDLSLGLL